MKCPYCFKPVSDDQLEYHWRGCTARRYEIQEENARDERMLDEGRTKFSGRLIRSVDYEINEQKASERETEESD